MSGKNGNITEYLKKREIPLDEFVFLIHSENYMGDNSVTAETSEDGTICLVESIWSMNRESRHVLVTVGKEGFIDETCGSETAEALKKGKVRVI